MVKKYEELLSELGPVRKPGYVSPREKLERERKKFSQELIEALEEAQRKQTATPQSSKALAKAAYDKLQYDFPLVSHQELSALVASYRKALDRDSAPPYQLTTSLAATVAELATALPTTLQPSAAAAAVEHRSATADNTAYTAGEQALLQGGTNQAAQAGTCETSVGSTAVLAAAGSQAGSSGQAVPDSSQQLQTGYQQLGVCLFLKLLAYLLSKPLADATVLLARYEAHPEAPQEPGLSTTGGAAAEDSLAAQWAAQPGSSQIPASEQAAEEDDDNIQYEPIEVPPVSSRPMPSARCHASLDTRGGSTSAVARKLVALSHSISYALVSNSGVWTDMKVGDAVVGCLELLGRHELAPQLTEVSAALLTLVMDRLAAEPADMDLLSHSWAALGVNAEAQQPVRGRKTAASSPAIPTGTRAALAMAVAMPSRLQTASARTKLWHQVHDSLLPCLTTTLETLAATKGMDLAGQAGADLALTCRALEFLVLHAPPGSDLATDLLQGGAFRALVLLFATHGANASSEALRRAMLLLCAASAQLGTWATAVPTFMQQLAGNACTAQGPAALHGAVWPLVLPSGSMPSAGSTAAITQLLSAAAQDPSATMLSALCPLLELLLDCKQAARSRRLWDGSLTRQLQALLASVQAVSSQAGASKAPQSADAEHCLGKETTGGEFQATAVDAGQTQAQHAEHGVLGSRQLNVAAANSSSDLPSDADVDRTPQVQKQQPCMSNDSHETSQQESGLQSPVQKGTSRHHQRQAQHVQHEVLRLLKLLTAREHGKAD